MADTYIRLIQRRDTAANWQTENPVLDAGEWGYETDSKKIKIGDGTTAWNALPYFTSGGGSVSWDDITGKPTIPAPANDGTLSITIDGVTHKFTANQKEDIDIEFTTGGGGGMTAGNGLVVSGGVISIDPTSKFKFSGKQLDINTDEVATTEYVNEKIDGINAVLSSI